ncbi:MAG TPA: hypothetical protein VFD38_03980 [Myxococcaceae bacterium]|nr:hypothetical protein [Myxococcaceae bacterium]
MRLLLPLLVLAMACSGHKKAKYDPAADTAAQQLPPSVLPPPPPLGPDQSMAKVSGCSDSASPSEQDTVAYPPLVPGGGKRSAASEVQLGIQPGGVWVSHNLTHPCCTKAKIYVQRVMGQVNFLETVEGSPCGAGCMCGSQVQAAAGAPPGRYNVSLRIEDLAGSSIVKQSEFVVEAY